MTSNNAAQSPIKHKLPVQQLSILGRYPLPSTSCRLTSPAICRFAEPLASTSLLPYLPEMIRSFGVPDAEVGKWTGTCAATFSVFQASMGIAWGRASDRYGRKPAILLGLTVTMITSLLFGFSKSLAVAIFARAVAGAGNGNVGIIRTTVAEMVPYKELQPRAFSIMPLVWNIGSIFGPAIGGALANPLRIEPGERPASGSLFEQFPYALPNIVSACFFFIGIVTGFLFLHETLETRKDARDTGLLLGRKVVSSVKVVARSLRSRVQLVPESLEERQPLIKPSDDEPPPTSKKYIAPPPWKDVLTKQTLINLALYAGLAMHNMAFDQVLPVYLSDKRPDPHAPRDNFFNFAGGFGLSSKTIGQLNAAYAVYGMFMQFLVFPPLARRFGILRCYRVASIVFPIIYALVPFTLLLPTLETQVAACFVLQLLKESCAIFAFPCSTILLTNSATSLRIVGTINGVATSVSAIGRAAGPALTGLMYTLGAKKGYLIAPWWFLTAVALIAAVPVLFVVEQDGFGDHEPANEEPLGQRDQEDLLVAGGTKGAVQANGQSGSAPAPATTP